MRVMVFSKANEEMPMEPTPEALAAFAAMDAFMEEMVAAGVFVAAAGLKPTAQSKRVLFDGRGGAIVTDGPFTETKEVIVGFSIWEVKDMDEAMAWAKRCPSSSAGEIEIRPFMEAADLADFVTPEELATPRDGTRGKLGVA
jgi:hypothetical protein